MSKGIAICISLFLAACTPPVSSPPPAATYTPAPAEPTSTVEQMVQPTPTPTPGWELVTSDTGPAPRFDHVLVYDPQEDRLVVFGGRGDETFGDTWIYEIANGEWVEVVTPGPLPRFGMAAAYDPQSHRVFIFGGQAGSNTFFNDVWAFDLATETWSLLVTSGGPPPARYGTSAIVDQIRNRLIISHGFTTSGRFDDTWALDLATLTWTDISPAGTRPLKRCLHEAVYDFLGGRMLLFGGCSSGFGPCPQGDLWAFDLATHTWTELTPAEGPSAVSNPALVFDTQRNEAILFGGNSSDGPTAHLWALDAATATWSPLDFSGPAPRRSHDAALDARGQLWVFGGIGEESSNELWRLVLPG